jgi:thioredoxin reductase
LDESHSLGGQVLEQADPLQLEAVPDAIRRGNKLLADLEALPVEIHRQSTVWGVDGNRVAYSNPEFSGQIEASALIIATGGREFVPPFPGWTLPGVMTLGGAQHLIKRHAVLPGKSILLAGTGPLLWALASALIEHGSKPHAILDFGSPLGWIPALPHIAALKDRLGLGWHYLNSIRKHCVRYVFTRRRLNARGGDELSSVSAGKLSFKVDVLCVGFGFRPNIELAQLTGCELVFDGSLGGWIPVTDESMQTTQPGVYAVGECAGIGGAEKALLEGEIAALSVFSSLNGRFASEHRKRLAWLQRRRRIEVCFGRVLNRVCQPPDSFHCGVGDDIILCRCENIRSDEVLDAAGKGLMSLDGLKNRLRVGQGLCQGRTCGPLLQQILSEEFDLRAESLSPFHVRPPVKPVALEQLERLR